MPDDAFADNVDPEAEIEAPRVPRPQPTDGEINFMAMSIAAENEADRREGWWARLPKERKDMYRQMAREAL